MHTDFLGESGPSITVWVSNPTSPYTSWSVVRAATAAHPVTMLSTTSGTSKTEIALVNAVFGIHANVIAAYPTTAPRLQGFLRGDSPVTQLSISMGTPEIVAGKAKPILVTVPVPPQFPVAPYLKGVPTVADLAKRYPPKTRRLQNALIALEALFTLSGSVVFAQTKTPPDRVAALQAAVRYALGPASHAGLLAAGLVPGYLPAQAAKLAYVNALKYGNIIGPFLR